MDLFNMNLSKLLKRRDPIAFEELLNRYSDKVFRLAMSVLKKPEDVEDVVQDVFLTVYSRIDSLKEDKALSSWIYRITVNTSMMKLRKNSVCREVTFDENLPGFNQDGSHRSRVRDWSRTPEDEVYSAELMDYLKESLEKLPVHDKIVLQLKDMDGLRNQEVADILDISLSAVKSRLHRARLLLRESISDYFGEGRGDLA